MLQDKNGENITPSDLLAGILVLVPGERRFTGQDKLHTCFYALLDYWPILREFDGFDKRWPQVWSEKIGQAYGILSLSKMVMYDGVFHSFGLTKSGKEYAKSKILSKFTAEQILDSRAVAYVLAEMSCACSQCVNKE